MTAPSPPAVGFTALFSDVRPVLASSDVGHVSGFLIYMVLLPNQQYVTNLL